MFPLSQRQKHREGTPLQWLIFASDLSLQHSRGRAQSYTRGFLHKATCTRVSPSKNRYLSKILLIADECVPTAVGHGSHSLMPVSNDRLFGRPPLLSCLLQPSNERNGIRSLRISTPIRIEITWNHGSNFEPCRSTVHLSSFDLANGTKMAAVLRP